MQIDKTRIKNWAMYTMPRREKSCEAVSGGVHPWRKYDCEYSQPFIVEGESNRTSFEYRQESESITLCPSQILDISLPVPPFVKKQGVKLPYPDDIGDGAGPDLDYIFLAANIRKTYRERYKSHLLYSFYS